MERKLNLTKQFLYVDDEFKEILNQLCCEIDKIDTNFLSTIGLLTKIPFELAMLVVDNLNYNQDDYRGVLNSLYYDEFKADIKEKWVNNKSKFENRILSQRSTDYIEFVINRFLTLGEIENLIKLFIEDEKLNITLEDVIKGEKEIVSKNIKILFKAHKILSRKQNIEANDSIMKKMDKVWLVLTSKNLIDFKEKQKLNV